MRKSLLSFPGIFVMTFLMFSQSLYAREWIGISSPVPMTAKVELLSSNVQTSILKFSVNGFFKNAIVTERGQAFIITCGEATQILQAGSPDLPKLTASIIIPDKEGMKVEVTASSYLDFQNIEIAPSKGNLLRNVNPDEVPFKYGEQYSKNGFYPEQITSLQKPYILRDLRGQTVVVNPFQYNPVTKVLRVYTSVTVKVSVSNQPGENVLNRTSVLNKVDNEFVSIYNQQFKNHLSVQYIPTEENGNLLVICPQQWMSILQPLVDWKIQRGIPTEIVDVITAGGTAVNIKDYITTYYNTHNLTHVLLIGDDAQIPSLMAAGGASDPGYGYILGNDSYAEVFVGRFSALTTADVQTQVDRTLTYEKYPDPIANWYHKGVVVASNQGPGDDGEMDWEHEVNIRADFLGFTYTDIAEVYDGTHPGTTDATGDPNNIDLFNIFQDGIAIMSYTGHGSTTSFGTTGMSNGDVQQMTNVNKLPFIWSVGCVNGDFQQASGPCIGEVFLNAQHNGQPTGAIATMMSSINQSWDPPMDAQDEMVDILVESYANNIKRTFGGISVNGCMHMNDQYGQAGNDMTDTWICFGDPTLQVRTATPQQIVVTHPFSTPVGTSTLNVNCNTDGAYVALTMNGIILSTGTVSGGMIQLNFPTITSVDTLTVTVTGFNLMPYMADIMVIPANGPYVVYQSNNSHDVTGNNNGIIEYDETVDMDITLSNLGLADANNLTITLSTTDQYVNIINATASLNNILAVSSGTIASAFSYVIAANIPDQHSIQFLLNVSDGSSASWISVFTQVVNAPALSIGNYIINDAVGGNGNGILEPGETGDISFACFNNGHSDALAGFASLSTTNPNVTLNAASVNINGLAAQTQSNATFNITLASNLMFGTPYDLTCQWLAGVYNASKLFYCSAGENLEDFETNNFNKYGWGTMGTQPWFTTNYLPFQGNYCAQSGIINDYETSGLRLGVTVMVDDSVSFWYKVSSEQDWDYLYYKIDNVMVDRWSGIIPWTFAAYPVTGGLHILMFSYEKDGAFSTGMDCAWLDNIKLPPGAVLTSINDVRADENGIICYPNPATSIINIAISGQNSPFQIQLMDLNGKLLKSIAFNQQQNLNFIQFSIAEFSAGMYMLKIESDNNTSYRKIIVE